MLTRHIAGTPVAAIGLGCMGMSMAYGPAAVPRGAVAGARYAEGAMRFIGH